MYKEVTDFLDVNFNYTTSKLVAISKLKIKSILRHNFPNLNWKVKELDDYLVSKGIVVHTSNIFNNYVYLGLELKDNVLEVNFPYHLDKIEYRLLKDTERKLVIKLNINKLCTVTGDKKDNLNIIELQKKIYDITNYPTYQKFKLIDIIEIFRKFKRITYANHKASGIKFK